MIGTLYLVYVFASAKFKEKADAMIGAIRSKCQCCSTLWSKIVSAVFPPHEEIPSTKQLPDTRTRRRTVREKDHTSNNETGDVEMVSNPLTDPLKHPVMEGDKTIMKNPMYNFNKYEGRARSKTESSVLTFKDSVWRGKTIKMLSQKLKDNQQEQKEGDKTDSSIDINDESKYVCKIVNSNDEIDILSLEDKEPGWYIIIFKQHASEGGTNIVVFNENNGTICNHDSNDDDLDVEWNMQFDLTSKSFYYYHKESLATRWEKPIGGQ